MPMQLRMRLLAAIYLAVACFGAVSLLPQTAAAQAPYSTYYRDSYDQLHRTQAAYIPDQAWGRDIYVPDGEQDGEPVYSPLQNPQDLFVGPGGHLYIADTGNNRIVQLDQDGKPAGIFNVPESPLRNPQGVFVAADGHIYVADTGNQRVVRLDRSGRLVEEFKRPDSRFLPASFKYDPVKLVVDKRGFMYIAVMGGYQGLLQLDPQGNFQSFFGANPTDFTWLDAFKRLVYTREMYEREISKRPGSLSNAAIDHNGLIYTVTKDVKEWQIKKFNIAGINMLANKGEFSDRDEKSVFGEALSRTGRDRSQLLDLTVDQDGNLTVIDGKFKFVSQYDADGNLLFFWGGDDQSVASKLGVVKSPSAIASNEAGDLYIADSEKGIIQKFTLSEFGALVHEANRLTQDGRYEESEPLWAEVNRRNAYYVPALTGLAKAAYKKEQFEQALGLFRAAGHAHGYSDAFWQTRFIWLQQHFGLLATLLGGGAGLVYVWRRLPFRLARNRPLPAQRPRLVLQLAHVFTLFKHPLDGFAAIRHEEKGGWLSSLILFMLALASFSVMRAKTSFIFNPSAFADQNLLTGLLQFAALWLGWVTANYLIGTLYRGESRLRDVAYGSSYALFPLIVGGLPLTLLSNLLTLHEAAIFQFLKLALFAWIGLLFFWKVQALQNYGVGETMVSLFFSIAAMAVFGTFIFITFGLTAELTDFLYAVYQELTIR